MSLPRKPGAGFATPKPAQDRPIIPNTGFVRIAFTHAFRHLRAETAYAEALRERLAGGGDTDTNGCIVGGLLGALHGEDATWLLLCHVARISRTACNESTCLQARPISQLTVQEHKRGTRSHAQGARGGAWAVGRSGASRDPAQGASGRRRRFRRARQGLARASALHRRHEQESFGPIGTATAAHDQDMSSTPASR